MRDTYEYALKKLEENIAIRRKQREEIVKKIYDTLKGGKGDDFSAPLVPTEPKSPTNLGGYKKLE